MPREATINYDQVATYAEVIRSEGAKPTPRLIRERHGSGSFGTIHKLLGLWEAKHAQVIETTLTLPPSLQRIILEFIGTELSVGRVDLEARLARVNATADDLAADNERLATQIETLLNDVESLRSEKSILDGRFSELEATLCSTREETVRERQAAENARTELAKLMLRLEAMPRLEAELAEIRKVHHAVDRRRQEVERDLAVAKSESQLLEQSRSDHVRSLEARLSETQDQLRMALTQLREVQDDRLKVTSELAMAQASRADEGTKAAERIGKLEGVLAAMEKVGNVQFCPPA